LNAAASPATNDLDRVSFSQASFLCGASGAVQQIFVFRAVDELVDRSLEDATQRKPATTRQLCERSSPLFV
jgi:hypothetical protein